MEIPTAEVQEQSSIEPQQTVPSAALPQQPHPSKPWIVIIILFFLGITAYLSYQNWQLRQQLSEKTPPANSTNLATPTPDPIEGWQLYEDKYHKVSFRYPVDKNYSPSDITSNDKYLVIGIVPDTLLIEIQSEETEKPLKIWWENNYKDKAKFAKYNNTYFRDFDSIDVTFQEKEFENQKVMLLKAGNRNYSILLDHVFCEQCWEKNVENQILSTLTFINENNQNDTSNWNVYIHSNNSFLLKYPVDFKVDQTESQHLIQSQETANGGGVPSENWFDLRISEIQNPKKLTLSQYIEEYAKALKQKDNEWDLTDERKKFYLAREKQITESFKQYNNGELSGLRGDIDGFENPNITVLFSIGTVIYQITLWAGPDTGADIPATARILFDQILSTFKFTK